MSQRIAVVFGGPSSEAAVSRVSGQAVAAALGRSGYEAELLELDQQLPARLVSGGFAAVVPTTHGPLGEDGCLQGLLEVLAVPYAGAGVLGSAVAADKNMARRVFHEAGLPVARGVLVHEAQLADDLPRRLRDDLGPALVVKPRSGGSAIGVGRVRADDPDSRIREALEAALTIDSSAIVEAFMAGAEVTCGVLENAEGIASALPPTRIFAKAADWYDFNSRYGTGGSEHQCPADFSPTLLMRIQEVAVQAHRAVSARDLSRVDFVVAPETAEVTLLEVNTLPGMTPTSLFPEAAAVSGMDFDRLCDHLVKCAIKRGTRRIPEVRAMPA